MKKMLQLTGWICLAILFASFVFPVYGYYEAESIFGFYALFGFVAFCFIIFFARILQRLLARRENYYAPYSTDNEKYNEKYEAPK